MKALEEGRSVRCKSWEPGCFVSLDQGEECKFCGLLLWKDLKNEWELYEEPQKTYTFMEVVQGLKEGKKFVRKYWIIDNINYVMTIAGLVDDNQRVCRLYLTDFEATDWIEVK